MSFKRSLERKARRELKKTIKPDQKFFITPEKTLQNRAVIALLKAILPPNNNFQETKDALKVQATSLNMEAEALIDHFAHNQPFPTTTKLFTTISDDEYAQYLQEKTPETTNTMLGRLTKVYPRTPEGTAATARYFSKKLSEKD